jgi:hypothetical protein
LAAENSINGSYQKTIKSSYQKFSTIRLAIKERLGRVPFKLEVELREGNGIQSYNVDDLEGLNDLHMSTPLAEAKKELPANGRIYVRAYSYNHDFLNDYLLTIKDSQVVAIDGKPWEAPPKAFQDPALKARQMEVEAIIQGTVKKLVTLLRRSKRFHADKKAAPRVRISFSRGRKSSRGGRRGVSFAVYRYSINDTCTLKEYAHFENDPEIGSYTGHWKDVLKVLVAHEVAHWAQYSSLVKREPGLDYSRSHGSGFREIYRYLRTYLMKDINATA